MFWAFFLLLYLLNLLIWWPFDNFSKKFDLPKARLNRARGQEGKWLFKSPGRDTYKTKTNIVVDRHDGAIVEATRRATPPRIDDPGAATKYFYTFSITIFVTINPSTSISRSSYIIMMPVVSTPFINVSVHII